MLLILFAGLLLALAVPVSPPASDVEYVELRHESLQTSVYLVGETSFSKLSFVHVEQFRIDCLHRKASFQGQAVLRRATTTIRFGSKSLIINRKPYSARNRTFVITAEGQVVEDAFPQDFERRHAHPHTGKSSNGAHK